MEVIIQILLIDLHELILTLNLICRTFPDDILEVAVVNGRHPEQTVLETIIHFRRGQFTFHHIIGIAGGNRPFTHEALQRSILLIHETDSLASFRIKRIELSDGTVIDLSHTTSHCQTVALRESPFAFVN